MSSWGPSSRRACSSTSPPRRRCRTSPSCGQSLLALAPEDGRLSRKALRLKGLLAHFGRHEVKDYNAAIGDLLKAGKLHSGTGKARINDDVLLAREPFSPSRP